jgi:membrane protease YdiL (CAAX protease family)
MESVRPRLYSLAWAFYLLLALAGVAWVGWRGDLDWRLFLAPERWWRDVAAGLVGGGALLGLWALARRGLASARRVEDYIATVMGEIGSDEVIALAVISSVAEEIFFRAGVQGSWGWLWASVLFAVLHTGPGPAFRVWTLFALVGGGTFGALTLWSGNLTAAIVAHGVVNGWNLRAIRQRGARRPEPRDGNGPASAGDPTAP